MKKVKRHLFSVVYFNESRNHVSIILCKDRFAVRRIFKSAIPTARISSISRVEGMGYE